jgi:hypothetical protein
LARGADPVEFENVAKVDVVVAFPEESSPRFEFGGVHFNGRPTTPTSEVVMVGVDHAAPIEALATVGHDDIDVVRKSQGLELGVDRRERDSSTVASDERVELLGTNEALDAAQHTHDFAALGRISSRTHGVSVPVSDLISGMILISVLGMIPKKAP